MRPSAAVVRRLGKPAVFLAALLPALLLVTDTLRDRLGANPIEAITHRTGWWALSLLLVTLAVTPLRRITGWNGVARYRRMLGLFAFTYATLHFLTYLVLDQFFAWSFIVEDVLERPYITVGFTSFVLLIPLAVTSTRGWIRRLGARWQRLHRLAYVAAAGGVLHFLWLVKADLREPLLYLAVFALLMLARVPTVSRRLGRLGRLRTAAATR